MNLFQVVCFLCVLDIYDTIMWPCSGQITHSHLVPDKVPVPLQTLPSWCFVLAFRLQPIFVHIVYIVYSYLLICLRYISNCSESHDQASVTWFNLGSNISSDVYSLWLLCNSNLGINWLETRVKATPRAEKQFKYRIIEQWCGPIARDKSREVI